MAGSDISLPLRTLLQVDETALLFTSLLAMATGITAGLAPAMRTASLALIEPLKESGRGSSLSKRQKGFRHALIVSEVALACTLLVGAGLLTRSLLHVLDADLGFNPENTIALRVDTGSPYAEHFDDLAFFDEALRRVRSIPGVETAALTDTPPMGHNRQWTAGAKGRVYQRGETPPAYLHVVSECLLSTMGIPLVAGRDFTQYDDQSGPRVVLVNETFANSLWPGESPLGKVLMIGQPYEHEVIGIVRDVRHLAFEKESGPEMYLPIRQTGDYSAMHLVVRGAQSPDGLAVAVRAAVGPLKPTLPLTEVRVLEDVVDKSLSSRRFLVLLLAGFACFALVLVSLGIYAVISYSVNQRKLEIGIRMALGASAATLQRSVLIQTFQLAFVGMTVGLAASWVLGRTIQSLLFDVAPSDPMTFATALVILTAIALLAGYLPARRASRLNPVEALGAE